VSLIAAFFTHGVPPNSVPTVLDVLGTIFLQGHCISIGI